MLKKQFRNFNNAREFVKNLRFKTKSDWTKYCKSGDKPEDIPTNPNKIYSTQGWINYGNWLGTGKTREYLNFEDAKKFVHSLQLKSITYWKKYCITNNRPNNIPSHPDRVYKNKGWINWGDFLGTGRIADQKKQYRSFEDAKKFVHSLQLKNINAWKTYCKSGNKPNDIPAVPTQTYAKKGWINVPDWLGNGNLSNIDRVYLTYDECSVFAQENNIMTQLTWELFCKSGNKPNNIPSHVDRTYPEQWAKNGKWGGFLGTGNIANQEKQYRSFEDARSFVRALGIKNHKEWKTYCKSGNKPNDIPSAPWFVYTEWKKK
jgi:hypothetical protein